MNKRLDWFVLTKKTAFMQRLADLVRTGHYNYLQGEVAPDRAGSFAGKMDEIYEVDLSRLQQSRKRKRGLAGARLLMLHQDGWTKLNWTLLITDGERPPEAEREKWRDARVNRIQLTGYELVRLTRPGASHPAWTWRYTREREDELRHGLIRAIRTKRDDLLRQLIHSIWRTPGFAGAREQVKRMEYLIVSEWARHRGADPEPEIPKIAYVRRVPDIGRPLSQLGLDLKRGVRRTKLPRRPPAKSKAKAAAADVLADL